MSKLLRVMVLAVLLTALFASSALADVKPDPQHIPQPVTVPTDPPFGGWWIELDPDEGGNGIELPGDRFDALGYIRGGPCGFDPTTGGQLCHGLPIGFNYKYMQGPADGIPTYIYGWLPGTDGILGTADDVWGVTGIAAWNVELTNEGYEEIWVGTKGYVMFHDPIPAADFGQLAISFDQLPTEVPLRQLPNNFIAPFLTDLAIEDNTFNEVTSVGFRCTGEWANGPALPACPGLVAGPAGCVCAFPAVPPDCGPVTGFWTPCTTVPITRPRGKLLYKTVETPAGRKFVVQWSNARVYYSGSLATFQVQLWEGNNAILFLFKDFKPKSFWETPQHASPFTLWSSLVVGMEDSDGVTGVGQAYLGEPDFSPDGWRFWNPLNELTIMGFVADEYAGVRPFVP